MFDNAYNRKIQSEILNINKKYINHLNYQDEDEIETLPQRTLFKKVEGGRRLKERDVEMSEYNPPNIHELSGSASDIVEKKKRGRPSKKEGGNFGERLMRTAVGMAHAIAPPPKPAPVATGSGKKRGRPSKKTGGGDWGDFNLMKSIKKDAKYLVIPQSAKIPFLDINKSKSAQAPAQAQAQAPATGSGKKRGRPSKKEGGVKDYEKLMGDGFDFKYNLNPLRWFNKKGGKKSAPAKLTPTQRGKLVSEYMKKHNVKLGEASKAVSAYAKGDSSKLEGGAFKWLKHAFQKIGHVAEDVGSAALHAIPNLVEKGVGFVAEHPEVALAALV